MAREAAADRLNHLARGQAVVYERKENIGTVRLPETPDRPSPGPHVLVLRAAFVPDGKPPPPEFSSVFHALKFPATLDRATGEITCDNVGMSFHGDIRAEWHPDPDQGTDQGEVAGAQDGDTWKSGGA